MYIDNVKFAKNKQKIQQKVDVAQLKRVQEIDQYTGEVEFTLSGDVDLRNRPVLSLVVYGIIDTLCQNCLESVSVTLDNSSHITVFFSEEELDLALFADVEHCVEDGVLFDSEFNVMELVEDEIIMLLPVAAKHLSCIGLNYHDQIEKPFSNLGKTFKGKKNGSTTK